MAFDDDVDRMLDDFDGDGDQPRALATSTAILEAIRDGRRDPVKSLDLLEAAVGPQFDAEGGRPVLVLEALRSAIPAFRHAEAYDAEDTPARLDLRCRPQALLTRTYHVMGKCERAALEHGYTGLSYLMDVAGGPAALADVLRRPTPSPVGEHGVAALAIFMATIRRCKLGVDLDEQTRDRLLEQCRRLLNAHLLEGSNWSPVVYSRSDALAAQGFYVFKELGGPQDAKLVDALYRFDHVTRPTHARAQATRALRDLEWARFTGDVAAAERYRQQAIVDLARFRLLRHQRVTAVRGYLAA